MDESVRERRRRDDQVARRHHLRIGNVHDRVAAVFPGPNAISWTTLLAQANRQFAVEGDIRQREPGLLVELQSSPEIVELCLEATRDPPA